MPFQELCRDLIREDPAVKECHIYGKNGQGQFGIDLEAPLHGGGCWTGQCKAYEELASTDVRDAADEFWKHRSHWKERGAKRFIVLAGCGVEKTNVWEQVRVQKKRFELEGIEFDLWDSRELACRLRPHRSVVERYCTVGWADIVCGTASAGVTVASAGREGQIPALALPLMDEISELRDQRLAQIREQIRTGKELSAERELEEMCRAASWQTLPPKIRARALRQRIGLMLGRRQDIAGAQKLLAEAKAIAPDVSLKVPEALIAYHVKGAEAALRLLTPPSDLDEWNLQLALQLNLGRPSDVLKELDAPRFQLDAEAWRLRAVAMLSTRNISGARLAIEIALAMNPAWRRLKEAAAVIDYYSALSPAVDTWLNFEWPTPPEWHFVRRDDESMAALRRAAKSFEALASAPEITQIERKGLEVWHLAALAIDPSRETEAATLARTLLDRDPGHVRIAIWASHHGYEFDRASVRAALEAMCSGKPETIEPVQAFFAMLANENEVADAGRLLDAHRDLYEHRRALSIWRFQRAQAWMAVNEKEKARALLADEADESERSKTEAALIRVEAARGGSRENVAQFFAQRFETTKADADLFAACEAHLYGRIPEYVADHSRELVRRIGTESALRLALDGCFAAGKFDLCLELLDQHIALFPGRNPPPVVHRLRVECLRRSGRLVEAQRAAEVLVREAGEAEDLFAVFETQRSAGDMAAAAMTGRQLLARPDITPEGLLHLSMHLGIDAPEVAKEAFKEVLKRGVKTAQQAAIATQIGFDLGFDDQLGPVIAQAIAAAGQPGAPFVQFSMAETLEMMAERRGAREQDAEAYGRGNVPVHLYAQADQIPLAVLYRGVLLLNEEAELPVGSFATMTRHGSRDEPRSLSSDEAPSLFLDVTSFLLAGHLDLLDVLETEFVPIHVSPHLPSSLQEQLGMLAKEQIARQPAKSEVLDLIAKQRISLLETDDGETREDANLKKQMGARWCSLLAHAREHDGYLIDFLPVRSNDASMTPIEVSAEVQGHVRSTGDLVQALKQSGVLTVEQCDLALQRLGGDGAISGAPTELKQDACVVLEGTIIENLAHAGVLRVLTGRCRVAVAVEEHRRLLAETEARRTKMELATWLRRLRDRLRRGLQDGRYVTKGSGRDTAQPADFANTATGECAVDLLDKTRPANTWTCCDDRFIGRFKNVGESRLIDIFDVLHDLHRRGKISGDVLFSKLACLRRSNARYLPVYHEEILHQLSRAAVGANGLVETPELASLRRYTAACVLDTKRLQRPPPNHPQVRDLTEIKCIMTFYSAGSEALVRLWQDESLPVERVLAASDWLLHQFLFDLAGAVEVWNQGNSLPAVVEMAGISDANLLFRAIALAGKKRPADKGDAPRQKLFVRWLMSRLEPDAPRLAQFGRHLREALLEMVRMAESHDERAAAAIMCGELYMAFPEELQRAVRLRKADFRVLKLDQWQPMTLHDCSFDLRDFFRSAERALQGREAVLTARVPAGLKFSVQREQDGDRLAIVVESKETKKRMRIRDFSLGLVQREAAKREAAMHAERHWLDVSRADADRIFPEIAGIKNLNDRMRQYYELRKQSLALHFSSLATRFGQRDVQISELNPPSVEALLKHIRVPPRLSNGELPAHLHQSAEILIGDEGFEEAFVRIATLPVTLPAPFAKVFSELEPDRRAKWVRQALEGLKTPIIRLHLAGLLLNGNNDEVQSAVDLLCGFCSDEGSRCFDAFEAVLTWTYREIIATAELDLTEAEILAATWSYAARLHQLLSACAEQAKIAESFEAVAKPRPRELLRSRHDIWLDAAGPQLVSRETLAVFGMAVVLEGRSLTPDQRTKIGAALRKLCFPFGESPTLPALPLLRIRTTQRNTLGSFLAECRTETLATYLSPDEAARFSDSQIQTEVEHLINQIVEQPNDTSAWSNAVPFLGMHPPPTELRDIFRRCLLATGWAEFAEVKETTRQSLLLFFTSQAANFSDDEILTHFRFQLTSLARRFATTLKNHSAVEAAAQLLANCAHFLALSKEDEPAAAGELVSTIGEICEAWPRAATPIWRLNAPLLLRQSAVPLQKLWPLVFRLRATSGRIEP